MNGWFRSWHGAPTDPKWLFLAAKAGVRPCHVAYTWWALLDHASQSTDRGYIGDFDQETFAHFAGLEASHVSRIVTTLTEKGMIVDGKIAQWVKRQPKREDETAGDRKRRQRAKNGGNPPNGGGDDTPDQAKNGAGHAMSRNVTLDKDKRREEDSVANATGTVVPLDAAAFCKAVFDSGVSSLMKDNPDLDNRGARAIVGRWRQKVTDAVLLDIFRGAESRGASLFLEYVTRAVENHHGQHKSGVSGLQRADPIRAELARIYAEEAEHSAGGAEDYPGAFSSFSAH